MHLVITKAYSFFFVGIMKLITFVCPLLFISATKRLNMIDDDNLAIHFPTALKSTVIFLRSYNYHYATYLSKNDRINYFIIKIIFTIKIILSN